MMNKCAKFHKDSLFKAVKKLNSISRARLNFWTRPILCTTLYRNLIGSEEEKACFKTSDKDGNMGRLRDVSPSQGLLQSVIVCRSP